MTTTVWDGVTYLKEIAAQNKQVQDDGYLVTECSGVQGIQGLMDNYRKENKFVMIDNLVPGRMVTNSAGGFFNRRTYSCHFIIRRDQRKGLDDYNEKMSTLRALYRQFISRLITDASELLLNGIYLRTDDMNYVEPGPYGYGGSAGLYFQFSVDDPTDLVYDSTEWQSK